MAKQGQTGGQGLQENKPEGNKLEGLTVAAREAVNATAAGKGLPPVHLWNPPFCGDLDMRIAGDGTWFYMGTPIGRPALVRLFSTILKREDGKHFLVTPVEKVGIRVDDAPFMAVEMQNDAGDGGRLLTPYLHVRADLWAKVTRALYYDLVDMGEERVVDGEPMFGVESGGEFFAMADAKQVRDAL